MKVIECFSIQTWDGGDRHNHAFYLTSEAERDKYLAKNKFDAAFKVTLIIFDTLEEAEAHSTAKVRERALAKLDALERKALGL